MPRATLKAKSNAGLVSLSEAHPDAAFEILGAWPYGEELRLLVETDALGVDPLTETLGTISDVTDFEVRHASSDRVLCEIATKTPEPHGAMADSGSSRRFRCTSKAGGSSVTSSRHKISSRPFATN